MRVFDTQRKVIWLEGSKKSKCPLRLGPKSVVSTKIGSAKISAIKIIGRKVSGDGFITILIKNDRKATVFSKSFKLTKKALSEISFPSDISGSNLNIFIKRPASSSGSVHIERVLMEGVTYGASLGRATKKGRKVEDIDYKGITDKLSRRMNLAIIIPYGLYGGGEVYVKNLISDGHKDFNIDVLFPAANRLMDELSGCSPSVVRAGGISGLASRLHSNRYDAVVFYNSKKIYEMLRKKRQDGAFSSDVIEIYHSDFLWSDAVASIRHREGVDKLFRVSEGLAKDITGLSDSQKICVPVGVDPGRFEKRYSWPSDVKKNYKRTIGMVARLSPEKNIEHALSVMKLLPEFQLVILGSGPLGDDLKRRKESENISNVTFLGHKRNVEQYNNAFDALLLTSKIEGTPISIIEAMMCGLPVFTTPVGQIRSNYSNLHGVNMLSGEVGADADVLKSFDYENFDGSELRDFSIKKHGLQQVRETFFTSILNSSLSSAHLREGVFVLDGVYI